MEYRGQVSKLCGIDSDEIARNIGPNSAYLNAFNATFVPGIRPIASTQIAVADYTGMVLPVVDALILTACILLAHFVVRLCLKDVPGLGWEVITAHERKSADKLVSGLDSTIELSKSRKSATGQSIYWVRCSDMIQKR